MTNVNVRIEFPKTGRTIELDGDECRMFDDRGHPCRVSRAEMLRFVQTVSIYLIESACDNEDGSIGSNAFVGDEQ